MAAALIGGFFIAPLSNAAEGARDGRTALQLELQRLESATDIVLMIIPSKMSFLRRMNEKDLPNVACVYQISRSNRGPSYADVREILQSSIVEFQKGSVWLSEVRLGVFFRDADAVMQAFYFEDWSEVHEINGVASEYRMVASADSPNRFRALVTRQDVILIKNSYDFCPHS
jgi:hypothetical protein